VLTATESSWGQRPANRAVRCSLLVKRWLEGKQLSMSERFTLHASRNAS
jgi:hypothetical protein